MVAWLASANYTARGLVHFSRHHHYHRVKTTWAGPLRLRVYPHPATCTLTDTASLGVCVYILRLGIFFTFSQQRVLSLRGRVYFLHIRGILFTFSSWGTLIQFPLRQSNIFTHVKGFHWTRLLKSFVMSRTLRIVWYTMNHIIYISKISSLTISLW